MNSHLEAEAKKLNGFQVSSKQPSYAAVLHPNLLTICHWIVIEIYLNFILLWSLMSYLAFTLKKDWMWKTYFSIGLSFFTTRANLSTKPSLSKVFSVSITLSMYVTTSGWMAFCAQKKTHCQSAPWHDNSLKYSRKQWCGISDEAGRFPPDTISLRIKSGAPKRSGNRQPSRCILPYPHYFLALYNPNNDHNHIKIPSRFQFSTASSIGTNFAAEKRRNEF